LDGHYLCLTCERKENEESSIKVKIINEEGDEMKKIIKILTVSAVMVFMIVGLSLADTINVRPVYTTGATLDSLQATLTGIGSTVNVRTDQEANAIFTNQSTGSIATYVASLSWNADSYPFEFGIYEYGNITNKVAVFTDSTNGSGVSNPGDYTTINFDALAGSIYSEYHNAGSIGSAILGQTTDWMDSFGFYFSWNNGQNVYYSEDSLNGTNGASFLAYLANGDNVTIAGLTANDANHWYMAMEGWGGVTDFNDIVVQLESVKPVPEPATMLLLGLGLIGLAGVRRFKK